MYHFDGENNFNIVGENCSLSETVVSYIHNDSTEQTDPKQIIEKSDGDSPVQLSWEIRFMDFNCLTTKVQLRTYRLSPNTCRWMSTTFLYAYDSSNETLYRTGTPLSGTTAYYQGLTNDLELILEILFSGTVMSQPIISAEVRFLIQKREYLKLYYFTDTSCGAEHSHRRNHQGTPTAPTSQKKRCNCCYQ